MRLEVVGLEVRRLDADGEHADLLRVELRQGGVEARGAADVVPVRQQDDARGAERRPAHLRYGGDEGVVEAGALGELRRLREHRLDLLRGRW